MKFKYFPGKSLQVLNKTWSFELPKSQSQILINLTFNTFVMHRLTIFQEIQEEIFDCFSKNHNLLSLFIGIYLCIFVISYSA